MGEFDYPITILCNNGDVMELTLIGCCEVANVGVADIRPVTSQHEVEQWMTEGAPFITTSDNDYPTSNNKNVLFDSVNPCQNGYRVVTIRNYWYCVCACVCVCVCVCVCACVCACVCVCMYVTLCVCVHTHTPTTGITVYMHMSLQ